jgi:hypothetical protein
MIKALGTKDGHPLIIAGLSNGNIRKLKEGKPILMKMALDGEPFEILIMYGDTEQAMVQELIALGVRLPTVPIEDEENHTKHVHG